jgi:hypothetical protein
VVRRGHVNRDRAGLSPKPFVTNLNNAVTLLLRSLTVLPQGDRKENQLPGNESAY